MTDDTKETLWALLLLLCFALAASAYVFKKGLDKADRTTHELLLKCVIIITSVVPRQLPMQTALAVNTALMALIKARVRVKVRARARVRVRAKVRVRVRVRFRVNTALTALIKAGVYCTEPYRVPFAGKIDAVLFDKTLEPEPEPEAEAEAETRTPNPNPNPKPYT